MIALPSSISQWNSRHGWPSGRPTADEIEGVGLEAMRLIERHRQGIADADTTVTDLDAATAPRDQGGRHGE